jgi:hypothetical protein
MKSSQDASKQTQVFLLILTFNKPKVVLFRTIMISHHFMVKAVSRAELYKVCWLQCRVSLQAALKHVADFHETRVTGD